ncbi:unnamed protein product [Zymoseptoria tritici ST99CH_3D7]|uniref:Uncharacterized protein n=1 Tax=Zymoseptoria tritici (strain ST99CH_3D7) TaxID=1276538 RepID=A0A1X7RZ21_ZYMT9|nr:unnamed protein product [Zymoseptoria tritici ST99CH_3D7]
MAEFDKHDPNIERCHACVQKGNWGCDFSIRATGEKCNFCRTNTRTNCHATSRTIDAEAQEDGTYPPKDRSKMHPTSQGISSRPSGSRRNAPGLNAPRRNAQAQIASAENGIADVCRPGN